MDVLKSGLGIVKNEQTYQSTVIVMEPISSMLLLRYIISKIACCRQNICLSSHTDSQPDSQDRLHNICLRTHTGPRQIINQTEWHVWKRRRLHIEIHSCRKVNTNCSHHIEWEEFPSISHHSHNNPSSNE